MGALFRTEAAAVTPEPAVVDIAWPTKPGATLLAAVGALFAATSVTRGATTPTAPPCIPPTGPATAFPMLPPATPVATPAPAGDTPPMAVACAACADGGS